LAGIDSYILVLDTKGINVWCAAGKGTFGTDELVHRIETTKLAKIVDQRTLTLPQLGATGISAHKVKDLTDFKVEYGPVRVSDLSEYLKVHHATPDMRKVKFTLQDRLVLIPVELFYTSILLPIVIIALFLFLVGNPLASLGVITALLSGTIIFPILLPWIPTSDFCTKGLVLGGLIAVPFAIESFLITTELTLWLQVAFILSYLMTMSSIIAFLALNFTGSTPFTSVSGVRKEIFTYIPKLAMMFVTGLTMMIVLSIFALVGGI